MICRTCGAKFEPRSSSNKFCSDICTPYKNWAMAWDTWRSMHKRCKDPKTNGYKNYGGAGVSVCESWEDYSTFLSDMGYKPSKKHQLDRVDPRGDYSKDNCRWVTAKENIHNKISTEVLEFGGVSLCKSDWAKRLGLSNSSFNSRLDNWEYDKVFTTPPGRTGPKRK